MSDRITRPGFTATMQFEASSFIAADPTPTITLTWRIILSEWIVCTPGRHLRPLGRQGSEHSYKVRITIPVVTNRIQSDM